MAKLYNRARMTVTSTGTGTLTLGTNVAGYQTFSSSGAQTGDIVSYVIEDGLNWEIGTGTYNSSSGTLTRTVTQSYNGTSYGTSAISVTTSAQVFISPLAADLQAGTSAGNLVQLDGSAKLPAVDGSNLTNVKTPPGGTTGQVQYNAGSNTFGGFTVSGDGTLNTSTGALSVTKTNGTSFGTLATLSSVSLASNVTGTLPIANGGTGITSFGTGVATALGNNTNAASGLAVLNVSGYLAVAQGGTGVGTSTGSGNNVLSTSPTLVTPILGTPTSGTLTSCTGLPLSTGVTGTLPIANGGTNNTTFTTNQVMYFDGTKFTGSSNFTFDGSLVVIGASGQISLRNDVLISDSGGTTKGRYYGDASGVVWRAESGLAQRFFIGANERMQLDSGGNLLVGTTSGAGKMRVESSANGDTFWVYNSYSTFNQDLVRCGTATAAGTGFNLIRVQANAVDQFTVRGDGTVYARNTSIQSLSDIRTKENIRDADDGLEIVTNIRPVRFDYKDGFGNNKKNQLGFVAQEIELVFPDAVDVALEKDENGETYKSVGPGALIPVLVKAIQELAAKLSALEARQ